MPRILSTGSTGRKVLCGNFDKFAHNEDGDGMMSSYSS
jgi:hypothetical protein